MAIRKTNKRNAAGVKNSSDRYRTFNGEHFNAWLIFASERRQQMYRDAGIRFRLVGKGRELFVHHMDEDDAAKIDRAEEATGRFW